MRWSADSFAPKDHARGVNMGDPRRFRLHVQRGNSGGLFRMDLPTQSWRASWLAAGDRLIKALGISSHSRGSGCSQVDLDPRPTPVRHQLRHPMRPQDDPPADSDLRQGDGGVAACPGCPWPASPDTRSRWAGTGKPPLDVLGESGSDYDDNEPKAPSSSACLRSAAAEWARLCPVTI
jgi:hypothetical protein